jgi:hypothetical protein
VRGTTLRFNPSFNQRVIAKALADDPQLYGAEYNSEWRSDLSNFIDRDLIEAAVDRGVTVRRRNETSGTNRSVIRAAGLGTRSRRRLRTMRTAPRC